MFSDGLRGAGGGGCGGGQATAGLPPGAGVLLKRSGSKKKKIKQALLRARLQPLLQHSNHKYSTFNYPLTAHRPRRLLHYYAS